MDPLVCLKEHAAGQRGRREVTDANGEQFVIFDDLAFSKEAKTSLQQYGKSGQYYTLGALLYLYDNRLLQHPAYVKQASSIGVQAVTRADRRDILDYLKGDRAELPGSHDPLAPISSTIPLSQFQDLEGPERKKPKLDPSAVKVPRIDHLLNDGPILQPEADPSELRDLNEQLTADKIAALRMKRKNNQRKNITQTFDEGDLPSAAEVAGPVDRGDLRERVWRTRDNCLEAATRSFASVVTLLAGLKTREEAAARAKAAPPPAVASRSAVDTARAAQSARSRAPGYSRYDQEQFLSGEASEFGVDSAQSTFVGQALSLATALTNTPKPASSASVSLPPPHPSTSGTRTVTRAPATSTTSTTSPGPMRPLQTPDSGNKKRTSRTPIIVIPSATSSLITMYNVKDMLQDMRYVTTEERKASGARRENECLIQRRRGEVTVPYRVVENPMKLTDEEWDRVVAVFAMGPAWQFKGWKWGGNPVDIFAHVAAFHITYDDMKVDPQIAKWSVTVIPLSRTKRHLDKARLVRFWDTLDKHIVKHKPHLRY